MSDAPKPNSGRVCFSSRDQALSDFLGEWFHQDFDLMGETVPDVARAFAESATPQMRAALAADIARFLDEHPDDTESAFVDLLAPEIEPTGLGYSVRGFLEDIRREIASPSGTKSGL
jgi:hypothetical protein